MFYIMDKFFNIFIFILLVLGLWLIFSVSIINILVEILNRGRYVKGIWANSRLYKTSLFKHIEMLVSIVYNINLKESVNTTLGFFIISFMFFAGPILILSKRFESLISVLLISLITASFPYLFLRIKLRNIRYKSSYEGDVLLRAICNNYKKHNLNMIMALDESCTNLDNNMYTNSSLFKLSISIKEAKNDEELEYCINQFVYSIDTDWAYLLGMNIYMAISDGTDVKDSLNEIVDTLKRVRKTLEEEKRYNRESLQMIKYIIPIMYVISVYILFKIFNFTYEKFLEYQIYSSLGFKMFLACIGSMIINFIVAGIFAKPKYDL